MGALMAWYAVGLEVWGGAGGKDVSPKTNGDISHVALIRADITARSRAALTPRAKKNPPTSSGFTAHLQSPMPGHGIHG